MSTPPLRRSSPRRPVPATRPLAALAGLALACLAPTAATAALETPMPSRDDQPVALRAESGRPFVRPGEWFPIAIVLEMDEGWHVNANGARAEELGLIPTDVLPVDPIEKPRLVADLPSAAWPKAVERELPALGEGPLPLYDGTAIVYLPAKALESATPGAASLRFAVRWQACDDRTCLMPQTTELEVAVEVVPVGDPRATEVDGVDVGLFRDFDGLLLPEFDEGSGPVAIEPKGPARPIAWMVVGIPVGALALLLAWLFLSRRI